MTTAQEVNIDKAIAWIDEHWTGQKTCPICENSRWSMGDVVGDVRQLPRNSGLVGQSAYPLIVVSCITCGYTMLFNAIVIGLVEAEA